MLHPRYVLTPVLLAVLGACTSLTPHYERPAAPVPAAWPQAMSSLSSPTGTPAATALPWRDLVQDDRLRQVVALALANNRDLRQAVGTIAAARATYGVQQAAVFPTIDANVGGSRARSLNNGVASTTQSASATLGLSAYEIDLFGKVRSLSDAALQTYLATEEAERSTRITLVGDTVSAWLALASDSSLLALAQRTAQSAEQTVALTRQRLALGVAARTDLAAAETTYQQARADVASSSTAVAQDRNALELLVGAPLDAALLPSELPTATVLAPVAADMPSSVLLQRPDVLQAEHKLQAANASISAARAAFFPSLKLTTAGGLASGALSTLFSGGAATVWSIAPSLSLPIFDGGANQASLDYAQAQRGVALAAYESAVQIGFKEVADALARRATITEQLQAQTALVEAARTSYQLAEARRRLGADTYLAAQVAQRTLYSAEQSLITTRLAEASNRITLYRVLGGGLAE